MNSATVPCTFCSTLNKVDLDRIAQRPKCGSCGRPIMLDCPLRLSGADFDHVIRGTTVDVLVDFYADWCVPCKMMAPVLDEIAFEHKGEVLIAKLDTDANPAIAARFAIRGIPTLIVFRNGVEKMRQTGALRRDQLEELLGLRAGRAGF